MNLHLFRVVTTKGTLKTSVSGSYFQMKKCSNKSGSPQVLIPLKIIQLHKTSSYVCSDKVCRFRVLGAVEIGLQANPGNKEVKTRQLFYLFAKENIAF